MSLAIEKGFDVLGIMDHYYFSPGFRDWGMSVILMSIMRSCGS